MTSQYALELLQHVPPTGTLFLSAWKMSLMQLTDLFYSQTFLKFKLFLCKDADCTEEITSLLHVKFLKSIRKCQQSNTSAFKDATLYTLLWKAFNVDNLPTYLKKKKKTSKNLVTALCIPLKTNKSETSLFFLLFYIPSMSHNTASMNTQHLISCHTVVSQNATLLSYCSIQGIVALFVTLF
jgi:hypothetical protein